MTILLAIRFFLRMCATIGRAREKSIPLHRHCPLCSLSFSLVWWLFYFMTQDRPINSNDCWWFGFRWFAFFTLLAAFYLFIRSSVTALTAGGADLGKHRYIYTRNPTNHHLRDRPKIMILRSSIHTNICISNFLSFETLEHDFDNLKMHIQVSEQHFSYWS